MAKKLLTNVEASEPFIVSPVSVDVAATIYSSSLNEL